MIMPKVCVECHSFPNNFTHVTIHSITVKSGGLYPHSIFHTDPCNIPDITPRPLPSQIRHCLLPGQVLLKF